MKNFMVSLIKLIVAFAVMFFGFEYFYKFLKLININVSNFSDISQTLINIGLYSLMAFCIYIVFKDELKSAFNRFRHKIGKNILTCLISFVVLFIVMMITNYVCKAAANSFHLTYNPLSYLNIFNNTLNFNLISIIVTSVIISPFIMVSVFVLGSNNLAKGKGGIFLSALLYAVYSAYIITSFHITDFGSLFINLVPDIILYLVLSYIYDRNNNVAFSIITYILYILFAGLLIGEIL